MERKEDERQKPNKAQTPKADFDRNREGLYGGLPEAREGSKPAQPQPRGN